MPDELRDQAAKLFRRDDKFMMVGLAMIRYGSSEFQLMFFIARLISNTERRQWRTHDFGHHCNKKTGVNSSTEKDSIRHLAHQMATDHLAQQIFQFTL